MQARLGYVILLGILGALLAGHASAAPALLRPGYTLARVSDAVPASGIAQLAFNPNDVTHVYAARTSGVVTRYDYDSRTGALSNAVDVASAPGFSLLGIAFYGDELYASLNQQGDARIARYSNRDAGGVYQTRHDFVHGIPTGNHGVNQIQIVGHTLYVGIGAARRTGNPAEENIYTMTIARIVDLRQVDFSGTIGIDFTGPVNFLADPDEWVDTAGTDGRLRYYASGFRNPFGIAIDADGDLWVTTNGNSDPGFLSPDLVYKVPLGGQGDFPPSAFGFGSPYIAGDPIEPLADLGQSPSPTGFDFVAGGPDAGKAIVAQYGATNDSALGRDVILIDPVTGAVETMIRGLEGPTDVTRDPHGRLLIADYESNSVWLLAQGVPSAADLVIVGAGLSNGAVAAGSSVIVSYSVKNQGTAPVTATYTDRMYLSANPTLETAGDIVLGTSHGHTADLTPSATHAHSQAVTIPPGTAPGSYYILVQADVQGTVAEGDEGNNVTPIALTVTAPTKDLVIVNLTVPTGAVAPGGGVTVSYSVKNQGTTPVTATYTDRMYLSANPTLETAGDTVLGTSHGHTADLAPSATHAHSQAVTIPATTPPGSYYLLVRADALAAAAEANEGNNVTAVPLTVTP